MSDFFLVLLVIFLLFSVFRRYIFVLVMNAVTKGLYKNMNKMQQQQDPNQVKKPDGYVTVEDNSASKKGAAGSNNGEYVDYVEIKD